MENRMKKVEEMYETLTRYIIEYNKIYDKNEKLKAIKKKLEDNEEFVNNIVLLPPEENKEFAKKFEPKKFFTDYKQVIEEVDRSIQTNEELLIATDKFFKENFENEVAKSINEDVAKRLKELVKKENGKYKEFTKDEFEEAAGMNIAMKSTDELMGKSFWKTLDKISVGFSELLIELDKTIQKAESVLELIEEVRVEFEKKRKEEQKQEQEQYNQQMNADLDAQQEQIDNQQKDNVMDQIDEEAKNLAQQTEEALEKTVTEIHKKEEKGEKEKEKDKLEEDKKRVQTEKQNIKTSDKFLEHINDKIDMSDAEDIIDDDDDLISSSYRPKL